MPVAANGFLIDMPQVFEDFVTVAVGEELHRRGGRVRRQHSCYLDTAGRVRMQPDLVWHRRGAPVAVLDAKYKAQRPSGFPDADLYQLLAYCTALDLPPGHLVYARGNEEPGRYVVRNAGVEIVCHAVDLQQQPEALLAQMSRVAAAVAEPVCLPRGAA